MSKMAFPIGVLDWTLDFIWKAPDGFADPDYCNESVAALHVLCESEVIGIMDITQLPDGLFCVCRIRVDPTAPKVDAAAKLFEVARMSLPDLIDYVGRVEPLITPPGTWGDVE